MYRLRLPFPDTTVLLQPRWGDLSNAWHLSLWLLVGLCLLAAVAWLYRSELRSVRSRTAAGLLLLRLVVLLAVLLLVGLQPIVVHSTTEEIPGRVLIAMDRSQSMDIADPQRPPVDKLRLARALKLASDLCSDGQLEEWIRQYEERGSPEWATRQAAAPDRRSELAEKRRLVHDQVCQRVDRLTRTQVGRLILSRDGLGLLDALRAKHQVELLGFAREVWDLGPDQLDKLFQLPATDSAQTAAPAKAQEAPRGSTAVAHTDLGQPLERALERSQPDEGKILGLVLLTDGQHNWGPSPVSKALDMGEHHQSIYPIALGARQAPPDIAVVSVNGPTAVFKDVDVPVEARLKVSGLPAQDLTVELQRSGQPPLRELVHHDGSDRSYTVRFQVRLQQTGAETLTVRAKPVPGEIRPDNNSRTVVIQVADDKAKVLLVDGEARWEYHYLAQALARDPTVQTQSVVFTQPRLGRIPEDQLKKTGNPRLTFPSEPDALAAYDCIILGDVAPAQVPSTDRSRLEEYVADRGGTLVILAGKRYMPLAYELRSQTPVWQRGSDRREDPLLRLLPIEEPRAIRPQDGFAVTLTPEGKLTPFLQMGPAPGDNAACWAELPRHLWGVIGRAKPGATPLAYLHEGQAAGVQEDRDMLQKAQALIVRQNYGFGRVLFVGLDSTWRWRFKTGDAYHHRFWGQVVRWAASDKPLVAGNEHVRFGTRQAVYRQGQEVDLTVRLGERVPRLHAEALAGARIVRQVSSADFSQEAVALVPLKRREAQPSVLEGLVRDLPTGQYGIELVIPEIADKLQGPPKADGKPGRLRATFAVLAPESEELVDLATNWPLLEELAAKSGGKVFTPQNASDLVELLTRQATLRTHHTEHRLWQWWVTLAILLLLLTAEWMGRKWAGLP